MLYLERNFGKSAGWIRVFSTADSPKELQRFRCLVRAPEQAFHQSAGKGDRNHLVLFGYPADRATMMLPANMNFETPVDRIAWEKTKPDIMKRHPTPFGVAENDGP